MIVQNKKLDGTRDTNYKLPHIAIGIFSEYLVEDIVEKFECIKIGTIKRYKNNTIFSRNQWTMDKSNAENLNVNGVDTFIIFDNCGVLDKNIKD